MVYLGTVDGRFIALDQHTGTENWSVQLTTPRECDCAFTSSPQLAGNVLIGGSTGGDTATSAKIYAVNAMTGETLWAFDIIKDDETSWPGGSGKYGGGGAWLPGTYDAGSDTFYIGTGNAAADFMVKTARVIINTLQPYSPSNPKPAGSNGTTRKSLTMSGILTRLTRR